MADELNVMVCNFQPRACPRCARAIVMRDNVDFLAGATQECTCGLLFSFAEQEQVVAAADAFGGDMGRHV